MTPPGGERSMPVKKAASRRIARKCFRRRFPE
jgi:hypothetical protein